LKLHKQLMVTKKLKISHDYTVPEN
jgi:hypothetical protein